MISIYALFALVAAVVVIANGFGRRFAGGLLSQWIGPIGGTQVARLAQAAIVGGSVLVLGAPWPWALGAVPLAFAGATWGFPRYLWHPPFIRFKRLDDRKKNESVMEARSFIDTIGLSVNGVVACAPLAAAAWWVGLPVWPLVLAGIARGPAWWLAWIACPRWRWLGTEKWVEQPIARWVLMPTALAEFYSGAALGAGLIATMIGGR